MTFYRIMPVEQAARTLFSELEVRLPMHGNNPRRVILACGMLGVLLILPIGPAGEGEKPKMVVKTERFDRDPGWEGFNNRIVPTKIPTITQDFGYSATELVGKGKGEIGGIVWRSTTPASYAERIPPRSLNDKLTASGSFVLSKVSGGSGLFFGWFNARELASGKTGTALGWNLDAEKAGARLFFNVLNSNNKAHGKFATPFEKGKKFLPLKPDGTVHTWSMEYDPTANEGLGSIRFTLDDGPAVIDDLPAGFRKEGATFDRFGMRNPLKAGGPLGIHLAGLKRDGKLIRLTEDPHWEGIGNRVTFKDSELTGTHNFGFSETSFAGGEKGELGGTFWRTEEPFGYYADRIGPLTLDDPLEASGRVAFALGAADSDICLGWFQSADRNGPATRITNFLGISLGGPSRVGHYLRPVYSTATGTHGDAKKGPVLVPDLKPHRWSISYDPTGNGTLRVTLDEESFTLNLPAGHRAQGARFDRFGVCTVRAGGQRLKVYFDDLKYTAGRAPR